MIDSKEYVSIAIKEIKQPTFEVTKQYLKVICVELNSTIPRVARVDLDHSCETVAVYFFIRGERFFLVVNLSKEDSPKVEWVWVASGHRVYLSATSQVLDYKNLSSYLPFDGLTGWSKGDLHSGASRVHKFTNVSYEPNVNEAYNLEQKLLELLVIIEKSSSDIQKLVSSSRAFISICRHQYVGANAGIHLGLDILHRLSALNLALDIDTYIAGEDFE